MSARDQMCRHDAAELLRGYGQIGDSLARCLLAAERATYRRPGGAYARVQEAARVLEIDR